MYLYELKDLFDKYDDYTLVLTRPDPSADRYEDASADIVTIDDHVTVTPADDDPEYWRRATHDDVKHHRMLMTAIILDVKKP